MSNSVRPQRRQPTRLPPSLGFSRQEHWSGLPFPSPTHESEKWKWSCSVGSDSSRPHGLQPTRLLHPWDFPGKSTGVVRHCLLPSPAFLTVLKPAGSNHLLPCVWYGHFLINWKLKLPSFGWCSLIRGCTVFLISFMWRRNPLLEAKGCSKSWCPRRQSWVDGIWLVKWKQVKV